MINYIYKVYTPPKIDKFYAHVKICKQRRNYQYLKLLKIVENDEIFLYIKVIILFCAAIKIFVYRHCGVNSMFIGNDCVRFNRLEMKNINQDLLPWLEDIIEENNGQVERKEWKSKYNSYVVYDYEPFCTEGFEINIIVSAKEPAFLNFINYLYEEKVNTIEYLNSCIAK